MAKRKKIGLVCDFSSTWTGGQYYIFNIINALNSLPQHEKPVLVIFYSPLNAKQEIANLQYPFCRFLPVSKPRSLTLRLYDRICRLFTGRPSGIRPKYHRSAVDFIFPVTSVNEKSSLSKLKCVYWIPDLQHKFLPQFFVEDEIKARDSIFSDIAASAALLVLSSYSAKKDFLKFYPEHRCTVRVLQFATVLPPYQHLELKALLAKYSLIHPYFIAPNQFWVHKNHKLVINAAKLLLECGRPFQVVFTGKEDDYRHPGHAEKLKNYVAESGLSSQILFLGFINRDEQLKLMANALAVIQPSLFEGWSTVIEDAKSMNQRILASDLDVHREQCGDQARYFNPADPAELCSLMKMVLMQQLPAGNFQYETKIAEYARAIINLDNHPV